MSFISRLFLWCRHIDMHRQYSRTEIEQMTSRQHDRDIIKTNTRGLSVALKDIKTILSTSGIN